MREDNFEYKKIHFSPKFYSRPYLQISIFIFKQKK